MKQTAVSIVIPTFNRSRMIVRSLESVLASISPDDEVIVVDDGSTDDTASVLKPYFGRIQYVATPNRGVGAARNRGMARATRPLLAFNDSDDEWFADKLVLQRAFMQARPDVVFCFTDIGLKSNDGTERRNGLFGWHGDTRGWDELMGPAVMYSSVAPLPRGRADFKVHIGSIHKTMLRGNYVATQSSIIRRDAIGPGLCFADDVRIHEEYNFFIDLSKAGNAAYFDTETVWQWGHDDARISAANDFVFSTERIKVLTRTYGLDEDFLSAHRNEYEEMINAARYKRARWLIRNGQMDDAREDLRLAGDSSISYRLLTSIPGSVMRKAVRLKRQLARLVPHVSLWQVIAILAEGETPASDIAFWIGYLSG